MKRRFRLATVLRARQVQEDAARGAVLRARSDADGAAAEVTRRDQALSVRALPSAVPANILLAALCARQGMAAEVAAASVLASQASTTVQERLADYRGASTRRRAVQSLAEAHAAAWRAAEEAADQRTTDDLAKPVPLMLLGGAEQ